MGHCPGCQVMEVLCCLKLFSLQFFVFFFLLLFCDFTCDSFVYLKFLSCLAVERCSLPFEALFQCCQVSEAFALLSQWN